MVWLSWPTPSLLSDWVQARECEASRELPLVSDAVRERARRVILAEGTVERERERERERDRKGAVGECEREKNTIQNTIQNERLETG